MNPGPGTESAHAADALTLPGPPARSCSGAPARGWRAGAPPCWQSGRAGRGQAGFAASRTWCRACTRLPPASGASRVSRGPARDHRRGPAQEHTSPSQARLKRRATRPALSSILSINSAGRCRHRAGLGGATCSGTLYQLNLLRAHTPAVSRSAPWALEARRATEQHPI